MQESNLIKTASATLQYSSIRELLSKIEDISIFNEALEHDIEMVKEGKRLNRLNMLSTLVASAYHLKKYRSLMDGFLNACIEEEKNIQDKEYKSSPLREKCKTMLVERRKDLDEIKKTFEALTGGAIKKRVPCLTVIHGGKSKRGLCY